MNIVSKTSCPLMALLGWQCVHLRAVLNIDLQYLLQGATFSVGGAVNFVYSSQIIL